MDFADGLNPIATRNKGFLKAIKVIIFAPFNT
jgi:hypothetical protein